MTEHSAIEELVKLLSQLPGLGKRSARRMVLHMVKHKASFMYPLADTIRKTADAIKTCEICSNLDGVSPCHICTDPKRDDAIICVVEEVADLWAIERSKTFKGTYHVLGGTLSAMDGRGPDDLTIHHLIERVETGATQEVILAMNATVEGQTTAFYITERLKAFPISISRIAYGIPVGGELDYLDDGTLGAAFQARRPF